MAHIKMSYTRDEPTPPNIFTDFAWIRDNWQQLLDQYGECSIVVYKEQVIGVGDSYESALQDAENNLTTDTGEITPVHDWLHHPHPFLRVMPGRI